MLVRNLPNAGSLDEAEPDSGDFAILGEGNSGIHGGGAITASSPESMQIQVAAARVVINGTPYTFNATSLTLTPAAGGNPRFDLVGWTSAGPAFITGSAGSNPVFPDFDPKAFVVGASVYVGAGVSQLAQGRITEKAHWIPGNFKRQYTVENETVVDLSTPLQASGFQVLSDGRFLWLNSVLKRLGAQAMEWLTTLTLKQPTASVASLILKVATGATTAHTVFKVEDPASSNALVTINGVGQFAAANFKRGVGSPEGVITGTNGDEYTDIAQTNPSLMKWFKTTNGGNTGWVSLRAYVESESAFPTGALIPWVGLATDPIPSGFSLCEGGNLAENPSTQALCDLMGDRFGTAPAGFRKLPDIRNRVVGGASTVEIEGVGTLSVGAVLGQNIRNLTTSHLPNHGHTVSDPGHTHPQAGPRWYYKPGIWGWPAYRPGGTGTPNDPGLWVEDQYYNRSSKTGITVGNTGGGGDFNVMQGTIGMTWIVKW